MKLLKCRSDDFGDPFGGRHLNIVKRFGTDRRDLTFNLGNGPDPGIGGELANGAFNKLDMRHHRPGVIHDAIALDDDEKRLTVTDFDGFLGAHNGFWHKTDLSGFQASANVVAKAQQEDAASHQKKKPFRKYIGRGSASESIGTECAANA